MLIGCGGGFRDECAKKTLANVDFALQDEGQQYGNLGAAFSIARMPRKCSVARRSPANGLYTTCHQLSTSSLKKESRAEQVSQTLANIKSGCIEGRQQE